MKEGLDYTFGFAPIKHILLLLGIVSLLGTPFQILMPILQKTSCMEIIYLWISDGSCSFGALFRSTLPRFPKKCNYAWKINPFATAIFGAGLLFRHSPGFSFLSIVLMVVTGFGMMLHTASSNTILQTITD